MLNHQFPRNEEAALSRIQQVIDTLEAERAEVQEHLAWLDQQIGEFRAHNGGAAAGAGSLGAPRDRAACK